MANENQVKLLREGVKQWNQLWDDSYGFRIDLRDADLRGLNLMHAKLFDANLRGADLRGANLANAQLRGATLRGAKLQGLMSGANLSLATLNGLDLRFVNFSSADLSGANVRKSNLSGVRLYDANLWLTDLRGSNLAGAELGAARLIESRIDGADFTGCRIHGTSIWNLDGIPKSQRDVIITPESEPDVTIDNLKVASLSYLLLRNANIREVIDTITPKAVLILGRFTPERKVILDSLRQVLRTRGYLPILFDFEKPADRDLTETVSTLAHLARFVIADITDAKSIPQELQRIVPILPSVPIQPLIHSSQFEYAMFKDFAGYFSVLPPYRYENVDDLLVRLDKKVIIPALNRAKEIAQKRIEFEKALSPSRTSGAKKLLNKKAVDK